MGGFTGDRENKISPNRVYVLLVLVAGVLAVYAFYLFRLQILHGDVYQNRARQVSLRSIVIPSQRGEIFDRSYDQPLASNIDSFAIDIIPGEVPKDELRKLLERLSVVLKVGADELARKLPSNVSDMYLPVEVKSGVSLETVTKLAERIDEYPGVAWHSKPIRSYGEARYMAHVLGYVGDITRDELQVMYNRGYNYGTVLGKSGIEKQYDQILRGSDGKRYRTVDVRGRRVDETPPPEDSPALGKNLVLTLDRDIQRLSAKALGERLGSVLVLKPATGEILAMVSYPSFDPNLFSTSEGLGAFRDLSLDTSFPFLNRSIQSSYPPASTFKTVLTVAAVEDDAIPINKTIYCNGAFTLGDRIFKCHKKSGHGPLALYDALAQSCDVYFYTLGSEYLGVDKVVDYSEKFGLGEITGVDIPGEVAGTLPDPRWKEKRFNSRWVGGDTVNFSIGQGYLSITPIQLANAIAMIVNDGVVYKPHLLKEIREPITGELVKKYEPEVLISSNIKKQSFEHARNAMRRVITDGTAQVVITTDAVESAGKTGTGEIGLDDRWHSWFVAYAPFKAQNPEDRLVIVVMVEAANAWEWWAPKAANIILHGIFTGKKYEDALRSLKTWYIRAPAEEVR